MAAQTKLAQEETKLNLARAELEKQAELQAGLVQYQKQEAVYQIGFVQYQSAAEALNANKLNMTQAWLNIKVVRQPKK